MEGVIFIGIQASGKSTFFQRYFFSTHVRISLDMLKTRRRESILLDACIQARHPFVVDNTNPSLEERRKYISKLQENKMAVKGYYFQSELNSCLNRNRARTGADNIPEIGVKGTYNRLKLPSFAEGFDELFYVCIDDGEFNISEWKDEI